MVIKPLAHSRTGSMCVTMVRRLFKLAVLPALLAGAGLLAWRSRTALHAQVLAHPVAWLVLCLVLLAIAVTTAAVLARRARSRQRDLADAMRVAEASLKRAPSPAPQPQAAEAGGGTGTEVREAGTPARSQPVLSVIEGGRMADGRAEGPVGPVVPDRKHLSPDLHFEPICDLNTGAIRGFDVLHKVRPQSDAAQPRFIRNLPRASSADRSKFEIRTIEQALASARQALAGAGVLGPGSRLHVHASEALLDDAKAIRRVVALLAAHPALTSHLAICFEGEVLATGDTGRIAALEKLADSGLAIGASTPDFRPARLSPSVAGALDTVFFRPDDSGEDAEDDPAEGRLADVIFWCGKAGIAPVARGLASEASIVDAIAMGARTGCGAALAKPVRLRRRLAGPAAGTAALS